LTKQAGFIESALSDEVHHPQRTGLEKLCPRNGSPVFITWVKSRASGTVECRDRLKPSEGRGLRVMWTYRIGRDLFSTSGSCHGNHRGRRREGDCPPVGVASRSCHGNQRGKKGEGEVESPRLPCGWLPTGQTSQTLWYKGHRIGSGYFLLKEGEVRS
jgi:hypothetical protein